MAIGREERRKERTALAVEVFGEEQAQVALDLLELTELAWHDCYGEITPSHALVEDMFLLSEGSVDRLIEVARLAVADWRDVKVAAEEFRRRTESE